MIANAASGIAWEYLKDTSIDDFDLLYRTNLRGPLVLFQACQSLLSRKDDVGLEEIPSPNEARDGVFLPQTEGEVVLKSVDVVEKKGGIEKVKDEWRSKFVIISSLQGQFNRDPGTNLGGYGIMKVRIISSHRHRGPCLRFGGTLPRMMDRSVPLTEMSIPPPFLE